MKVKFNKETNEWEKLEDYSKDGYYMSEFLKNKLDHIKAIKKRDWDCVFCITGMEGSGKSALGKFCLWYLSDEKATIDNIAANSQEGFEKLNRLSDGSDLLMDEGALMFSAKDAMTKEQKALIGIFQVIRQKRMTLIIVAPEWFDLAKYIAVHRSRFLLRTVTDKNLKRGTFQYWGEKKKKILYDIGKKHFNSYSKPRREWASQFTDFKLPFEEEYIETKKKSLETAFNKMGKTELSLKDQQTMRRIFIRTTLPKLVEMDWSDVQIGELFGISRDSIALLRKEEGLKSCSKSKLGIKPPFSLAEVELEERKEPLTELYCNS